MLKPDLHKSEWALIDIDNDGFCNLMSEDDSDCTREDLKLPEEFHPKVSSRKYYKVILFLAN